MKKITLTVEDDVYQGLHAVIGTGNISSFINALVRPHVLHHDIQMGYQAMAVDEDRESEASDWCENMIGDVQ